MKKRALKVVSVVVAMLVGHHLNAQIPTPPGPVTGAVEGVINSVDLQSNGSLVLKVMDMTINVPADVPITSPTSKLTPAQVADTARFPGRSQDGFLGGTAIVNGIVDTAGVLTAIDLFVEPAENVVLGVVTANGPGQLQVNNVPVRLLDDPRIPASPPINAFGFEILPDTVELGTPASVEGYFAGGTFHAFLLEIDGNAQLKNPNPQIVINRAESRERAPNNQRGDEVEVRGAVTTAHVAPGVTTQSIRVWRVDNGQQTLLGDTTATLDPATPGFAEWRFRITTPPSNGVLGRAPTVIRARNRSAGANNVTVDFAATVIQ